MKPDTKLAGAYAEVIPLLRRMGTRFSVDPDDVAQEAWIRVLLARRSGDAIMEPGRYLLRVARNLFIDTKRAGARSTAALEQSRIAAATPIAQPDPERILAGKQRLEIALHAIGRLPPRCREAFELHRFEGLSYAVVARRMNISASMVEKHIAEAMRRLADALRVADGTTAGDQTHG